MSFLTAQLSQGTHVWVPSGERGSTDWVFAEVADDVKEGAKEVIAALQDDTGRVITLQDPDTGEYKPKTAKYGRDVVYVRNPDIQDGVDDLTALSYMHDPAILHALYLRYRVDMIYSYSGPILIAVNPYKEITGLYTKGMMDAYVGHHLGKLSPHVFAIAEEAFRHMSIDGTNQSILVSGESGAGKTETTKYILRYLAAMASGGSGGSSSKDGQRSSLLAQKVLESTPLLEAFGNARTRFNNNSSRFGKFIEIWFGKYGNSITGSALRTYLLEKSRVVKPALGERNFHIFYQLIDGLHPEFKQRLMLRNAGDYYYLAQSECLHIEGVSDAAHFQQTVTAMNVMGFAPDEQMDMFALIAAILHLGNVRFYEGRGEAAQLEPEESDEEEAWGKEKRGQAEVVHSPSASLNRACWLLGCEPNEVARSFLERQITVAGGEQLTTPLNKEKAENCRDSLAMLLYSKLFDWLVSKVNESLREEAQAQARQPVVTAAAAAEAKSSVGGSSFFKNVTSAVTSTFLAPPAATAAPSSSSASVASSASGAPKPPNALANAFIGILDIYGFECFDVNGFPQFCINYANERLQQHFNTHIFKHEQQEYIKEKIDWSWVTFQDNQGCIDLLENKPLCILALLDEECRFPNGSDESFAAKVRKTHDKDPFFATPRFSTSAFSLKHYAGIVDYEARTGFLDKNKDFSVPAHPVLLQKAANPFVKFLFSAAYKSFSDAPSPGANVGRRGSSFGGGRPGSVGGPSGSSFQFTGVATQFKTSLKHLMDTIGATQPHFVRCIKPNYEQMPNSFNKPMVLHQLRCGGVMEAVRIASAGYPSRTPYKNFYARYQILKNHAQGEDARSSCQSLFQALGIQKIEGQFGETKIFLKAGMIAHLEKLRTDRLNWAAAVFQKNWKRILAERRFRAMRTAAIKIQTIVRRFLAKKELLRRKRLRAALLAQKIFRMRRARKEYRRTRAAALTFQRVFRGVMTEKLLQERRQAASRVIQARCRTYLVAKRKAEEERKRREEEERKRREEEERLRREEEERKRKEEEERLRREEEERKRLEEERKKKEEEERLRKEEEERRKKEKRKKKREELERKLKEEEDRRRAEAEKLKEEMQRVVREEEAKRKREEEERKRMELEELQKKEEKKKRKEEEKAQREEEERKQREEEEERRRVEEEEKKKLHEEELKRKEEKRQRRREEEERRRQEEEEDKERQLLKKQKRKERKELEKQERERLQKEIQEMKEREKERIIREREAQKQEVEKDEEKKRRREEKRLREEREAELARLEKQRMETERKRIEDELKEMKKKEKERMEREKERKRQETEREEEKRKRKEEERLRKEKEKEEKRKRLEKEEAEKKKIQDELKEMKRREKERKRLEEERAKVKGTQEEEERRRREDERRLELEQQLAERNDELQTLVAHNEEVMEELSVLREELAEEEKKNEELREEKVKLRQESAAREEEWNRRWAEAEAQHKSERSQLADSLAQLTAQLADVRSALAREQDQRQREAVERENDRNAWASEKEKFEEFKRQMADQLENARNELERTQHEHERELEEKTREWEERLRVLEKKRSKKKAELKNTEKVLTTKIKNLETELESSKKENEELTKDLENIEEEEERRLKGTIQGRESVTGEEVEVEMLATVMMGSAEEGRKRLIGLVFAEEKGFIMGVPAPGLVVFRYLRSWGELSLSFLSARLESVLMPYTVSVIRALTQSYFQDNQELAFLLSNVSVMLHLIRKELHGVATPSKRRKRAETRRSLRRGSSSLLALMESYNTEETRNLLEIGRIDLAGNNLSMLMQHHEEENESNAQNGTTSDSNGSPPAIVSPVLWFEKQMKDLLKLIYTQLAFNIRTRLRNVVEKAILDKRNLSSSQSGTHSPGPHRKKTERTVALETVMGIMDDFLTMFQSNFVHLEVSKQFFQQAFRFIDSVLFNVLLLRKDLCTSRRASEIHSNISRLEGWLAETAGDEWVGPLNNHLHYMRQGLGLLLMDDVGRRRICEEAEFRKKMCPDLNVFQIRQLLSMFTPEPGHEKVPLQLLGALLASGKDELQGKEGSGEGEPQDLIIDASFVPPLRIKELHYIELSDVMSFPFPPSIKEKLQEASEDMKRMKQEESRESSLPSALATAGKSGPKFGRGMSAASRLEQQRHQERMGLGGGGSRISSAGESSSSSSSGGGGGSRAAPREGGGGGGGGGGTGMMPPAADWGEQQRSAQQLAWWRGTAAPPPRDRSNSSGAGKSRPPGEARRGS